MITVLGDTIQKARTIQLVSDNLKDMITALQDYDKSLPVGYTIRVNTEVTISKDIPEADLTLASP